MKYREINFKWELSLREKQFIDYLIDNDYSIIYHKQFVSKTKFIIQKDDVEMPFEIVNEIVDINSYIKTFEDSFEMSKQLKELL